MTDYRRISYWMESSGDDLTPRPPLNGSIDVDVAILGAGYTGLWTAHALQERRPGLKIALLEREIAGFGASGRNGGWCYPGFSVGLGELRERFGPTQTRDLMRALYATTPEIERVIRGEQIDAQFHQSGIMRLARGQQQLPTILGTVETAKHLGLEDHYQLLSRADVDASVRVTNVVAGLHIPHGGSIHPARLARGLARAVERRGATIYERTTVTGVHPGSAPRFATDRGDVRARTLVLAGEAWLSELAPFQRSVIPLYSLIVLTEPIPEERWAEIGWQDREPVASSRFSVDYLQRTADGRILFGGRGAPYERGSKIDPRLEQHEPTQAMLRRMTKEWFPTLGDIQFSHAWGGPLAMPRDWMPTASYDPKTGIARAGGYTGTGVLPANLFGRTLADLITGEQSELTALPFVNHQSPAWEPEPFRWAGIRFVQEGYARLDRQAERTGIAPSGKTLVERLGRH